MAAVDDAGPVTRSRIEAFSHTAAALSDLATQWRGQAQRLQQAADGYVEQVNNPNGIQWSGQTAVAYFDAAHADRMVVLPAVTHVHAMADVADRGGDKLLAAQQAALGAIAEAEADNFTVGDDLSITDNYVSNSPTLRAVRQAAAVGHRNYIDYHAALLTAENQRIAANLNAGSAQMAGMAPQHWRQPVTEFVQPNTGAIAPNHKGTTHAVDNHTWKQDPALPVDPKEMTEAEARAAWATVNADIADFNARCGRIFILPNEQAAYDACVAAKGPLDERQAAIRARLKDLGVPIDGDQAAPPPVSKGRDDSPPFPPPSEITGVTGHGEQRIQYGRDGHGVSETAMQDAVAHPTHSPTFRPDQFGGAYEYEGKDAVVILNKDGQVVTAWPTNRNGWRNP
jgi:hypothetical protein